MYPKLSDNIIEKICFSNFLSFVFESRCSDSEIIYFLSRFKIASWKNADQAANSNSFFK